MVLDLLISLGCQEVDYWLQEVSLDDGGHIHGMNRQVVGTCDRGEGHRRVRRTQEAKERSQTTSPDNCQLITPCSDK